MRKILHFLAFLIILFSAKAGVAQSFTVEEDSVFITGSYNQIQLDKTIYIQNNTSSDLQLRWVVEKQYQPTEWLSIGVCDNVNCFVDVDSSDYDAIGPGETTTLKVIFYPNNIAGTGVAKIYLYAIGDDRNEGKLITFHTETWQTSINEQQTPAFNYYPNPAREYLYVTFEKRANHTIEIYNVLGKKIKTEEIYFNDEMKISLADMPRGMYVISYKSPEGRVVTKTFTRE